MAKNRITGMILDNLWFWAMIAFGIMAVYGIWALIEAINMHAAPFYIPPRGW